MAGSVCGWRNCSGWKQRGRADNKNPRFPRVLSATDDAGNYARPACFMTSAAKSSVCFSMPSPTARRTNVRTSAPPAASSAASTVWLVSRTYGCPVSVISATVLEILPAIIFSRMSAGLPESRTWASAISFSRATKSAGTCAGEMYGGFIAAMCMARPRASSGVPPLTSTRTPMRPPWTYAPIVLLLSMRAMRRTWTFSPTLAIRPERASSTVPPSMLAAFSASMSATFNAAWPTASANARKPASLATKSVSELISTRTALLPDCAIAMRPSAAMRLAFLSALAKPVLRSQSAADSMLPSFSVSAFLHSIMPAPVRSRSSLTCVAVISAMVKPHWYWAGPCPPVAGMRGQAPAMRNADGWRPRAKARSLCTPDLLGGRCFFGGGRRVCRRRIGLLRRRLAGRCATARRLDRVAFSVELDELVFTHGGLRRGSLAFQHRIGGGACIQLHGANGVVVARDRVIDQRRVVIGVDDRDHRDAELLGFLDGDVFVADVDDEQRVGQAVHFLDAAEGCEQLLALATQAQDFVLDQLLEAAVGFTGFQFFQARHRFLDCGEVGQRAAEPALGHVRHVATLGFFLDRVARGALGANEQDHAALLRDDRDEVHRVAEQRDGLLEVDDVDLAAGAEDVRAHLGIPVTRLVAEMDAGFQHLAHGDLGHCRYSDKEPSAEGQGGRALSGAEVP